jgi:hypothetical protein
MQGKHPDICRHFKDVQLTTKNPVTQKTYTNKDKIKLAYKLMVLTEMLNIDR